MNKVKEMGKIPGYHDEEGNLHVYCKDKAKWKGPFKPFFTKCLTPKQLLRCCPKCEQGGCPVREIVNKKLS